MNRAALAIVAAALVGGCGSPPQQRYVSPTVLGQQALRNVVSAALAADTGSLADTFYMVGSTAVADGRVRVNHPFFSGVARGGGVTITGFQAEISSALAWAMVDYRWVARDGRSGTFARATLVLEPVGETWRIKHVHSSSATP